MESTTTSSKTPADFLKSIRGKRVVVKLNSGVDYRGTKRFANNKDCTQTGEENELSSSYIKKNERHFVDDNDVKKMDLLLFTLLALCRRGLVFFSGVGRHWLQLFGLRLFVPDRDGSRRNHRFWLHAHWCLLHGDDAFWL